jgi:L-fucose isomerase-like protein
VAEIRKIRAGFVGFGEVNTPREYIVSRCEAAARALEERGFELVSTPPVSDDSAGSEADRAIRDLSTGELDLLILCVAGWIPTWAVIRVVERWKHKPVLLWGLSGWKEKDRFVTTADQAGTTALRKPLADMGFTFKYIVTYRGREPDYEAVVCFGEAARAASLLRTSRIGMAGYRDMRLYGTMYDGVSLKSRIGPEIEHFDLLEVANLMQEVDAAEAEALASKLRARWVFTREPRPDTVERSVRLFLAFKAKIVERGYQAFSFADVDGVKKLMKFAPAGAMTLLHDEMDICSVPENDALGAVTQLMVHYLTGQPAAYLEFYEFLEDGALLGVPDYVPSGVVDGKVTVMPNAFGGFGEGLLNVSRLRTGKVTLSRLTHSGGQYALHVVTGMARTPSKWEEAGWAPPAPQLPSLEIVFDTPVGDFVDNVMSQHYIISHGDHRAKLGELCAILGIPVL